MPTEDKDLGVLTTVESGVVNSQTYPNQLRPHEDRSDDQPLAVMWNATAQLRAGATDMMPIKGTIVKVVASPGNGYYECAISIPEMELFSVTQRYKQGVKNLSTAVTNFSRVAEGYVDTKPYIGQECHVLAPATGDPSIRCILVKLGDRSSIGSGGGQSDKLANDTSAQDLSQNGGV